MPTEPARVLVVEDEETLRTAIGQALVHAGFVVDTAPDGENFAERIASFRPDAAVLDIMLPGENGLHLAQRLRAAGNTPVLFVTAGDAVDDRLAAFQVGDLVIDEEVATAARAGALVDLTATERRLLTDLAHNRGRTLSKTQILTQVWGYDDYDPNLVEAYVSTLRRKLDANGPRLIHTVRGIGYRLTG